MREGLLALLAEVSYTTRTLVVDLSRHTMARCGRQWVALEGALSVGMASINIPSQLVSDYGIILLEDSWILFEPAKQSLEPVYTQLVVVWQWIMKLSPR